MAAITPRTIMTGGRQNAIVPRERCQATRRAEMSAGLHRKENHPQGKHGSMDVKDGAG